MHLDLDAPLPDAIVGRTQGWFTHYRRYPVFSPAWARGRALRLTLPVLGLVLLGFGSLLTLAPAERPWGGMLQISLGVLLPALGGPALGSWVRRRGWRPEREWRALVAVIASLVLVLMAFNEWGAEPLKQQVAEWAGQVDEKGQRRRVAVAIGVTVRSDRDAERPAGAASAADAMNTSPPRTNLPTHIFSALLAFSLAGGFALPRWRRERDGLLALAREQELQQAKAARRETELRLSVLAAQVEPHFLFNTLAGVRSAIATDPARASELVDRLVDYLRASIPRLRADGAAEATLGAQLEQVRAYLALMKARMPRLSFELSLPPALRDAPFPPLMLISLAENAVKHGVEPKVGPVRIEVAAERLADGRLKVTVADDGVGFAAAAGEAAAGSGLGLTNIRERLLQMHGTAAALELRARAGGGVAASITLPAEVPENRHV